MFTKIYEKIKSFMKENYLFVILLVLTFVITFVELPFEVEMPGGTIDLGNRVLVNGEETDIEGSFNMAYVTVSKGKIPYILLGLVLPDWDVVKKSDATYENESWADAEERSRLFLEQSKDYATVVAMDAADIAYEISNKVNYIVYIDPKAKTDLKVGDDIISINGKDIQDLDDVSAIIQKIEVGEKVTLEVNRDGKKVKAYAIVYENEDKHYIGISTITTFDIDSETKVEISSRSSESGSSGGLMMTLMVYNALTKQDLTHGKKIVGTGTISLNGDVGEIGGVKFKLMGAVEDKADIFLVPKENYDEAIKVKEDKGYDIEIVSVTTLRDAIDYLEGM